MEVSRVDVGIWRSLRMMVKLTGDSNVDNCLESFTIDRVEGLDRISVNHV